MKFLFSLFIQFIITKTVSGTDIISGPEDTYTSLGDTVTLTCTVSDHTAGLVTWIRLEPSASSGTFCFFTTARVGTGCFSDSSLYGNFQWDTSTTSDGTYDQYNIIITNVTDGDMGEYACYASSTPSSGSVLCSVVDANNTYVEFNGTVYSDSNDNVGAFERQSYTLNAVAENSKPQTTFTWSITDGDGSAQPAEATSDNYTNDGSCEPFTSTSSLTYDLANIESGDFTITLNATNEITETNTAIKLTGSIATEQSSPSSPRLSSGAIAGIAVGGVVLMGGGTALVVIFIIKKKPQS